MRSQKILKKLIKGIIPYGIVQIYYKHKSEVKKKRKAPNIRVINYQVNNFCNSKCIMCNVWKTKDYSYADVDTYKQYLSDPLFIGVEHVGITGGEPTLVNNLPEYYKASIKILPNLKGLSLITNAISIERIKTQLILIKGICADEDKVFSVMLSLDGVSESHDINRGINGNFEKVMALIEWLKSNEIVFSTGTTITKCNLWDMDHLLGFLKEKNIYGRFRIAEFINRLQNDSKENHKYIRNFDDDEKYQLQLFFYKLIATYETDPTISNTYHSIINMLSGGKRLIECPYEKGEAINIGCHGDVAYCAPKSPVIGYLNKSRAEDLYTDNIKILERIKSNHCESCIHDYHCSPKRDLSTKLENEEKFRSFIRIQAYKTNKDIMTVSPIRLNGFSIFIVGWYGTETVGDKAILGGIIDKYKSKHKKLNVYVSSLYPFVTERTLLELKIQANVVPVFSESFFQIASCANEVIVGGGPLMELDELALIEWAFCLAKKHNNKTVIYGCGIGPLYTEEKISAVEEILKLSDETLLRDSDSVNYASEYTDAQKVKQIPDPSIEYICKIGKMVEVGKKPGKLACFLRELTFEYRTDANHEDFLKNRNDFEKALAENIKNLCEEKNMIPHFYSMHNFCIGNDDRDFYFGFVARYFSNTPCYIESRLSSVDSIIREMKSAELNLCMRFHSIVFANELGTNFCAVDYTHGGKIKGYLKDSNKMDYLLTLEGIKNDSLELSKRVNSIYHNK